jgi:2-polyprenyl-3-methyl-5-hydroxy-6-metoxy-1,4-benzoquinol methylase
MRDKKLQENNEIDFLEKIIPDLKRRKILEVGCGRGEFLTAMKARGYDIIGVEPDIYKHGLIKENAKSAGVQVEAVLSPGEKLPFDSETFDFIYCNNVIEHCKDPLLLLEESSRVLKPQGLMYFTVINRFAFRDPHYHLNFLNWLPRRLAEKYIILRRRSKKFINPTESRNQLTEMHYFTFNGFKKIVQKMGFEVEDLKEYKLRHPELISASNKKKVGLMRAFSFVYPLARLFYVSGFRLLLRKTRIS